MSETPIASLASPSPEHDGAPLAAEKVSLEIVAHSPQIMDRRAQRFGVLAIASNLIVVVLPMLGGAGLCFSLPLWILPFVYLAAVARKSKRLDRELAGTIPPPIPDARVRAVGRPEQLAPLMGFPNEFFEPRVFRDIESQPVWYRVLLVAVICILYIAAFLLIQSNAVSGPRFLDPLVRMSPSLGLILGFWLMIQLNARYLRLVPGRLDVLQGGLFRDRMWLVESRDLRRSKISVRFDKTAIEIESSDKTALTIRFGGVNSPLQFVHDLLEAAVSTHPAPALPDDALLG